MPIYKHCDRCGKRLPVGTRCACMDKLRQGDKDTDPHYGTSAWKTKRRVILDRYHYLDVLQYFRGNGLIPADMVHHIEPLKERPDLWLTDSNLIPLCSLTHAEVEAAYDRGGEVRQKMQQELRDALDAWQGEGKNVLTRFPSTAGPISCAPNSK